MQYAILLFLLCVGYLLVRYISFHPVRLEPVQAMVQQGLIEPVMSVIPAIQRMIDWQPVSKKYVPNKYGYGGLDPAGGERKGGDGSGIPDDVSVGWWNGNVTYSEKRLSSVQDVEDIPSTKEVGVGWWGDDWL